MCHFSIFYASGNLEAKNLRSIKENSYPPTKHQLHYQAASEKMFTQKTSTSNERQMLGGLEKLSSQGHFLLQKAQFNPKCPEGTAV